MASTSVQNSFFFLLPIEKQVEVFAFVLSSDGNLGSRRVCKRFLPVVNEALKRRWHSLVQNPPKGPIALRYAFSRIKNQHSIEGIYPENFNYLVLFRDLNREWKRREAAIPKGELKITPSHFAELQSQFYHKMVNQSLLKMWDRIWHGLFPYTCQFSNPQDVREWIACKQNERVREVVLKMNLSDLGIRFIPIEICSFPNLRVLDLSSNHIDALPPFLGNLKGLRFLNLEDNDLQELPEDFPNWTHLGAVNLSDNPLNIRGLQQIAEWKKNVNALQEAAEPMEVDAEGEL